MSNNSVETEKVGIQKLPDGEVDIPLDYSIKHPLQNTWTLWFYENDRNNSWEENQKEIASFNTVEDFWRFGIDIVHTLLIYKCQDYELAYTSQETGLVPCVILMAIQMVDAQFGTNFAVHEDVYWDGLKRI